MASLKEIFSKKVNVKNFTGEHDNSRNWLEYYFRKKYQSEPFSSMNCPSCGLRMYHKRENPMIEDNAIMVGAHVIWAAVPSSIYILPICKECNDKKDNLPTFKVKFDKLCRLPKE